MKLIYFTPCGGHPKNRDAIQRMCAASGLEYEQTFDYTRISRDDYDILMTIQTFIDPATIPEKVKIIYGPQFWVIPEGPLCGPEREDLKGRAVLNCLSPWVKEHFCEFANNFICQLEPFPFAVDCTKFCPLPEIQKTLDCIIYIKRRDPALIEHVLTKVNELGLSHRIFKYGSYSEQDYRQALHQSKFMIVLDATESQGFALQEAMASGIPLLVFDAKSMKDEFEYGYTYARYTDKKMLGTSVPYWSDQCGIKTYDYANALDHIKYMLENYEKFNPRQFILDNLSEKPCMNRILSYFGLKL